METTQPAGDTLAFTWTRYRALVSRHVVAIVGVGLDDLADSDSVTDYGWTDSESTVSATKREWNRRARQDAESALQADDTFATFFGTGAELFGHD